MTTKALARAFVALLFVLAWAVPVNAKFSGPLTVTTPSGQVFHVDGAAAKRWWGDWASAPRGGCECRSPAAAARYAARLIKRWGGYPSPPTYQVTAVHERPMILFAPEEKQLWYILTPASHGSTTALWDRWTKAGPAIRQIIATGESALRDADPGAEVTVDGLGSVGVVVPKSPEGPPESDRGVDWWAVLAIAAGALLVLGTAWRRWAFIRSDQGKRAAEPGVRHT